MDTYCAEAKKGGAALAHLGDGSGIVSEELRRCYRSSLVLVTVEKAIPHTPLAARQMRSSGFFTQDVGAGR